MKGAYIYLTCEELVQAFYKTMDTGCVMCGEQNGGLGYIHKKLLNAIQQKIDRGELTKKQVQKIYDNYGDNNDNKKTC